MKKYTILFSILTIIAGFIFAGSASAGWTLAYETDNEGEKVGDHDVDDLIYDIVTQGKDVQVVATFGAFAHTYMAQFISVYDPSGSTNEAVYLYTELNSVSVNGTFPNNTLDQDEDLRVTVLLKTGGEMEVVEYDGSTSTTTYSNIPMKWYTN